MGGFFHEVINEGVHDSLFARAFVFAQGDVKFAIIGCDVAMISPEVADAVRTEVSTMGFSPESVLIHASETHNGPDYFGEFRDVFHDGAMRKFGKDIAEPIDYGSFIIKKISLAVKEANNNLQNSSVSFAEGSASGIGFNRRYLMKDGSIGWNPGKFNPNIIEAAGRSDSYLPSICVFREEKDHPVAIFSGFAMHLALLEFEDQQLYSADYPYYVYENLKKEFGEEIFTHLVQLPCHEINNIDVYNNEDQMGYDYAAVIGKRLSDSIVKSINKGSQILQPDLKISSTTIDLEIRNYDHEEINKQRSIWYDSNKEKYSFLELVKAATVTGIASRHKGEPINSLVQAFQLSNETVIVGLPSEISVELGLELREKSPYANTIVIQLSNDWIGYIPTLKIFEEGNYEAVVAKVLPGEGERMVTKTLELLSALR